MNIDQSSYESPLSNPSPKPPSHEVLRHLVTCQGPSDQLLKLFMLLAKEGPGEPDIEAAGFCVVQNA